MSPPRIARRLLVIAVLAAPTSFTSGCGHSAAERRAAASPSVTALQQGEFDKAQAESERVLASDAGNAQAAGVAAIARFKKAMHQLSTDLRGAVEMLGRGRVMDHRYTRFALQTAVEELDRVDARLAAAAGDREFSLDLCLACWKVDWNQSGELDARDEKVFQIEIDADGNELPPADPRRAPTFHLDVGDVHWGRALVGFERAALELLLAYDWSALNVQTLRALFEAKDSLRIAVGDRKKFTRVSELLRFALDEADRARVAYLAEVDDDREWVPNPRQKSHPLPLPVDTALYDTWAGVVSDLRAILGRKEGVSVAELAQLGRRRWEQPPGGFLDLGGLLAEPRDIVIDLRGFKGLDENRVSDVEKVLRTLLGDRYVPTMAATRLITRLTRMRDEVDRGNESFERKLRYLFWLN